VCITLNLDFTLKRMRSTIVPDAHLACSLRMVSIDLFFIHQPLEGANMKKSLMVLLAASAMLAVGLASAGPPAGDTSHMKSKAVGVKVNSGNDMGLVGKSAPRVAKHSQAVIRHTAGSKAVKESAGTGLRAAMVSQQPTLQSISRLGASPPPAFLKAFLIYSNPSDDGDIVNHKHLRRTMNGDGSGGSPYSLAI
jgi:hypothetical protein